MGWFDESQRMYRFDNRRETGIVTMGTFAQHRSQWHINNAGWNSPVDYVPEKNRQRVAIIGDSYIEAWQVDSDENYPSVLRVLLGDSIDVYSFGVSGAPLSQYLHIGRYAVSQYDPDILVFNIVHNDFAESLHRLNSGDRHFMLLRLHDNDLVEETIPQADRSFTQFSRVKQILRRSALVRYLLFNLHIKNTLDVLRQRESEYVANIDPATIAHERDDSRRAVRYVTNRMARDFRERSIVFVIDAPRADIYAGTANESVQFLHAITADACAEAGIDLLDLSEDMTEAYSKDGRRFEFDTDGHWNAYGHEFVARTLAAFLERQSLIKAPGEH
jgi:lysophospholipase L1-like esterase